MKEGWNPYEELGVEKDASEEDIQKAAKAHAKRTHPDLEGGSEEAFGLGRLALAILTDAVRRKKFDNTGRADETKPDNVVSQARSMIEAEIYRLSNAYMAGGFKEDRDPRNIDVIAEIAFSLNNHVSAKVQTMSEGHKHLTFLKDFASRFSLLKPGEFDFIARRFADEIREVEEKLAALDDALRANRKACEIIAQYRFNKREPMRFIGIDLATGVTGFFQR